MSAATHRNRLPLAFVLAGAAVSLLGSALTVVALPWFVLQTTGSAASAGLTGFAVLLPNLLAGLLGGPIIDRIGFRRASVLADVTSAIGIGLIPTLLRTTGLPFWALLLLVFAGSALTIPGLTARRAMLPALAQGAGIRLERVNAAFESLQFLSILLGPPLAGILIGWLGPSPVLWVDAATFLVSAVAFGAGAPSGPATARTERRPFAVELRAGLAFLGGDRVLRALAVSVGLFNVLESSIPAVVLPVYVREVYGRPTDLGVLLAGFGGGALLGTVAFGALGDRISRRALWIGSYLTMPVLFAAAVARPPLVALVAVLTVVGLASGSQTPLLVTIRHERIPGELRGRVFAAFSAVAQAAAPLGPVLVGFAIQGLGLRTTLIGPGVIWATCALAMLQVPAFRDMEPPASGEMSSGYRG